MFCNHKKCYLLGGRSFEIYSRIDTKLSMVSIVWLGWGGEHVEPENEVTIVSIIQNIPEGRGI